MKFLAYPPHLELQFVSHKDSDNPGRLGRQAAPGKMGIDKFWYSKFLVELLELRPDIVPVHGSGPVDLARTTKDEAEIVQMRQNSLINDQVMAAPSVCCRGSNRKLSGSADKPAVSHGADGEGDSWSALVPMVPIPTTAGIRLNLNRATV